MDPGASSQVFGVGCANGRIPSLHATDPILGGTLRISVEGTQGRAAGVLVISPIPVRAQPFPKVRCTLYADLSIVIPALFRTGPDGSWRASFPMPNAPGLNGAWSILQAGVGLGPSAVDSALTPAVRAQLGPEDPDS